VILQIISTVISLLIFYGIIQLFRKKKPDVKHDEIKPGDRYLITPIGNFILPPQEPAKYIPPDSPEAATTGRPLNKFEQRKVDAQMKRFLEEYPNIGFWKDHPEYVDKYLDDIDLSELDLDK
jgi:hypothetical protein